MQQTNELKDKIRVLKMIDMMIKGLNINRQAQKLGLSRNGYWMFRNRPEIQQYQKELFNTLLEKGTLLQVMKTINQENEAIIK